MCATFFQSSNLMPAKRKKAIGVHEAFHENVISRNNRKKTHEDEQNSDTCEIVTIIRRKCSFFLHEQTENILIACDCARRMYQEKTTSSVPGTLKIIGGYKVSSIIERFALISI